MEPHDLSSPYILSEIPSDTRGKSLIEILCSTSTLNRKIVDETVKSLNVADLVSANSSDLKKARAQREHNQSRLDEMLDLNVETLHSTNAYHNYIAA
ncbi:MAG: hypothetical protein ABIG61_14425 [Planctomycetota bacterium]